MKKALAAFLAMLLGPLGYAVADKTIDGRVAELESSVSSLQGQVSSLENINKTYKVGDTVKCIYDTTYEDEYNKIYVENVTAIITDVNTDENSFDYYSDPYTVEIKVTVRKERKKIDSYYNTGISISALTVSSKNPFPEYIYSLSHEQLADNVSYTVSKTFKIKCGIIDLSVGTQAA